MSRSRHRTDVPLVFSGFQLDLRASRLMRGDHAIALRPKTWGVLRYLAERPGVLATKDELLSAVWPDVTIGEDTLNKSIGELRAAFGDQARTPRFIETVHRRGFRFIAATSGERAIDSDDASAEPGADGGHGRPFVGRAEELGRLAALLARANAGERQLVFVSGAAGIGKTALLEAFLASAEMRGAAMPVWVASGLCIEQHGHSREPYMPVLEALDRVARRSDADHVAHLLQQVAPMWLSQIPWLRDDDDVPREAPHALPVPGTERMLREFAVFAETLTKAGTLILVIEDLHWSDPSTVDLLSVLGQRQDPARLLVIGTYRPAELAIGEHALSKVVQTLRLRRRSVEIPLHELDRQEVQGYLDTRFPGADFAGGLAPLIHQHTDGNPLFMVALVDHLLSRGLILDTAPGWALSTALANLDVGVPDEIRLMIETQLDGLSPAQRSLLEVVSMSPTGLTMPIVAAVLGSQPDDAEVLVGTLTRPQRFLRAVNTADLPGSADAQHCAFIHELYRQVVYDQIPGARRLRLHRRLGETLEAAYRERADEIAPALAVHFEHGNDPARAAHYLGVAAARARQRFANREAVAFLEPALALAALLPDDRERRRREFELRVALAQPLHELHGFASERVRENSGRAYELGQELGSPEQLFPIAYSLWFLHVMLADSAATTMAIKLEDIARRLDTAESRLAVDSVLVRTAVYEGRFDDARRIAERRFALRTLRDPDETPSAYGADPVIAAHCHYAYALWFLGKPDRARVTMRTSLARARASGSPFTLAAALTHAALLEVFRRDGRILGPLAEQAVELSAAHGFALWHAMASVLAGWSEVQLGRVRPGIAAIERGLAAYRATGARMACTYFLALLAEACRRDGAFAGGLAAATEGLELAEKTLDRGYAPELWRLKGELLLASRESHPNTARDDGWHDAERCLLRSLESARAARAKSLELRTATSLARAWQTRGRVGEARTLLGDACEWFGTAESVDLTDARELMTELATQGDRRGSRPRARRPTA